MKVFMLTILKCLNERLIETESKWAAQIGLELLDSVSDPPASAPE